MAGTAGELRGLLLDSGDTVIGPRGGRWNPRFDFEDRLLARWPDAPTERFPEAFAAGDRFLRTSPETPAYIEYYRVILGELGLGAEVADEVLEADLLPPVEAHELVDVFPDALAALEQLTAKGVPIVVVSDAWVTLERTYEALGLREHFTGFVISEAMGCCKPDPRIYAAGSELLGLAPEDCLFVDDAPHLVAAAIDLGYQGRAICRNGRDAGWVPSIRALTELVDLF